MKHTHSTESTHTHRDSTVSGRRGQECSKTNPDCWVVPEVGADVELERAQHHAAHRLHTQKDKRHRHRENGSGHIHTTYMRNVLVYYTRVSCVPFTVRQVYPPGYLMVPYLFFMDLDCDLLTVVVVRMMPPWMSRSGVAERVSTRSVPATTGRLFTCRFPERRRSLVYKEAEGVVCGHKGVRIRIVGPSLHNRRLHTISIPMTQDSTESGLLCIHRNTIGWKDIIGELKVEAMGGRTCTLWMLKWS